MKSRIIAILSLLVLSLVVLSQQSKAASGGEDPVYKRLFSDKSKLTTKKGLITVHKYDEKYYLEVPVSLMGRELLLNSKITKSSDFSLVGFNAAPTKYFVIDKTDSLVVFKTRSGNVVYDKNNEELSNALSSSRMEAIYRSFPIKGHTKDEKAVLFDVTSFFRYSNYDIFDLRGENYGGFLVSIEAMNVNPNASFIDGFEVFDRSLLFNNTVTTNFTLTQLGLQTFLSPEMSLTVSTYVVVLPADKMHPRVTNPEVGSRSVMFEDYRNPFNVKANSYVTRHRLEKGGEIVYYVDTLIKESWLAEIKKAADEWNGAFEKCGMGRPIRLERFPSSPSFRATSPAVNVITLREGTGGISSASNIIDPRTGEILSSRISVTRGLVATIAQIGMYQHSYANPSFRTYFIGEEQIKDGLRASFVKTFGYSLGLSANLAGSMAYTPKEIRSPEFTQANGFTASVMDDLFYNVLAQPGDKERGVRMISDKVGVADYFTIKYLYSEVGSNEEKSLKEMVRQHLDNPRYLFLQTSLPHISDPRGQFSDLGNDPFEFMDTKMKQIRYSIANGDKWLNNDTVPSTLKGLFPAYIFSDFVYNLITPMTSYIGGIYIDPNPKGDGTPRVKAVPKAMQKRIVKAILAQCDDLSWFDSNQKLLDFTGPGASMTQWILGLDMPLKVLMARLPFMTMSVENSKDPYTQREYLGDIEHYLFHHVDEGKVLPQQKVSQIASYIAALINSSNSLKTVFAQSKAKGAARRLVDTDILDRSADMPPYLVRPDQLMISRVSAAGPQTIPYYQGYDLTAVCYEMLDRAKSYLERSKTHSRNAHYRSRMDFYISFIATVTDAK